MTEELLTIEEVAEALKLKPITVRRWAASGKLPASKMGRVWRFHPADVQAFMQALRHGEAAEREAEAKA